MEAAHYHHVDVFTSHPFSGNSLAVFADARGLNAEQMLAITQELRHFESIFLEPLGSGEMFRARVFDLIEELDFAGHPLIGAAAVLHGLTAGPSTRDWTFQLTRKSVTVRTVVTLDGYSATLDQGRPEFLKRPPDDCRAGIAAALNLDEGDLCDRLPIEVVSTGLRYLIVPLRQGLERSRIVDRDFAARLAHFGAQFVYVLDAERFEGRHWNNDGLLEDVATGSAAGTVGAYLVRHGRVTANEEFVLHQGRFAGRPSEIRVRATGSSAEVQSVFVGGEVAVVGNGVLHAFPRKRV